MKNNSKVIMAILLVAVVAIMLLFVFKPFKANNEVKNDDTSNNVAKEYVDIRYEAHNMESSNLHEDQNIVISNYEDLVEYINTVEDEFLLDMIKNYDEDYFMGQSLIVITVRDDLEMDPVKSVTKELNSNVVNVVLDARELEEFVTPNMVMNNIVIEVSSEDVQDISGLEVKLME